MILQKYVNGVLCRQEESQSVLDQHYDIIVVGVGTAGAIAALAAARNGMKVLGLEQLPVLGGQGTIGAVLPYYFGQEGGLYEEIDRKTEALTEKGFAATNGFHPDCREIVLEQELQAAGAEIHTDAAVTGVYLEGKTVKGVQWLQNGIFFSAGARVVIDCTAEAEICILSGCEVQRGRKLDGECQPFSLPMTTFYQGKLNCQFVDSGYLKSSSVEEARKAFIKTMTGPMYLRDPFEPVDRVISYSPFLGAREGRRIIGEETVTLKGYLEDRVTCEPVFYAYANLDKHGSDYGEESFEMQKWVVIGGMWGVNLSIPIPLGAMIPKGYEGLLAAGRHLSVDHEMASAVRMKRDMQKCGEAAAIAACESIRSGCPLKKVSYQAIAPALKESGCLKTEFCGMKRAVYRDDRLNPVVEWLTDPEDILKGLYSDESGFALLSCCRLGEKGAELLREWSRTLPKIQDICTLGLGLLNLPEALPQLRRLAFQTELSDSKAEWLVLSALCLMRQLGQEEDLPRLKQLCSAENLLLRPYGEAAYESVSLRLSVGKEH